MFSQIQLLHHARVGVEPIHLGVRSPPHWMAYYRSALLTYKFYISFLFAHVNKEIIFNQHNNNISLNRLALRHLFRVLEAVFVHFMEDGFQYHQII